MPIKTENQQWQDIINLIKGALQSDNITGWQVRRMNQSNMIGLVDMSIYITRVNSRRYGWQKRSNKWNYKTGQMIHVESYIEEVMYQITGFKKRNIADINGITSSDIMNALITYFQSFKGVKDLKALGYEVYRIQELREPPFVDDSDIYEKLPSFDIVLNLLQTKENEEKATNEFTFNVKGI